MSSGFTLGSYLPVAGSILPIRLTFCIAASSTPAKPAPAIVVLARGLIAACLSNIFLIAEVAPALVAAKAAPTAAVVPAGPAKEPAIPDTSNGAQLLTDVIEYANTSYMACRL